MKSKFTKLVSLFMSAVMTVSALSLSGFSSYAETGDSPEQTVDTQDKEIEYGGILGSMLSDEIDESVQEKQEAANRDYTVYKVYHDPETTYVGVDYKAKTECTLFIGFYNDEGTELITSVTKDLEASDDGYFESYTLDALPDHYLIKCFIVGKEFKNPLSKPCIYNKCTKQMQEILAKSTDDYEEEQVVNLDDSKSNNFLVLQEGVIDITPTESTDIYKGEDDNGNYIFENAVEIAKLKKGDKVFLRSSPDMVAFIVDEIETDDSNRVVIYHGESEIDDFIAFMKIDANEYNGDNLLDEYEFENENVTYEGRKNTPQQISSDSEKENASNVPAPKAKPEELKLPTLSDTFKYDLYAPVDEKKSSSSVKLTGSVILGISLDLTIYYDVFPIPYLSINCAVKESFECNFSLAVSQTFEFPYLPVFSVGVASICLKPAFTVSLTGKVYVSFSKTRYFDFTPGLGITHSESDPVMTKIDGKVILDFKIDASATACLLSFDIVRFSPYVGFRFDIHRTDPLIDFTYEYPAKSVNFDWASGITVVPYSAGDARKHNCDTCYTCDISLYFGIKITVDIFKLKKVEFNPARVDLKLGKFHINDDGFGTGACENYSRMIGVKAVDSVTKEPISGADVLYTYKYDTKPVTAENGKKYTTDSKGESKFFVPESMLNNKDYTYSVSVRTASGDVGSVNISSKWQWDPDPKSVPVYTIYITCKESALEAIEKEKKEKEKDPEETADKPLGPRTYVVGYARDEYENNIKDQNGNEIPTVFCTVYPDENSTDPSHPYQEVGYVSGKGQLDMGSYDVPGVKKIVVIDPETTLDLTCAFGSSPYESVDLSAMTIDQIPNSAFNGCENLKEVILPPTISKIGDSAFAGCTNLKHIDIPDSVRMIEQDAFRAAGLTDFTCPRDLLTIGSSAFYDCRNLQVIIFNSNLRHIGISAFMYNDIKSADIPASVKEIGESAFYGCENLRTVIINSDFKVPCEGRWTEISDKVFDSAYEGFGYIGKFNEDNYSGGIFLGCGNLKQAIFNDGVTRINKHLFYDRGNLTSVRLPSTLKIIENGAFAGTNLSKVELPEGVQSIDHDAFYSSSLKSITINSLDCYCAVNEAADLAMIKKGEEIIIYGHTGSTAEAFAKSNGNTFISIDKPQTTKPAATTTTTKTTTVTTTTVTTTVTAAVSTIIGPDKECLFIVVKDPSTIDGENSDKLLEVDNVAYLDQQTADDKGKVTFSFIPDAVKDLVYLFISEINYSKINKTVVNGTDVQTTWYPATDPSVTVYGDSNNDGVVELADAILIMQQMANPDKYALNGSSKYCITEQGMINGDVYEPGSGLTGNDALTIQEYLLGKRDNLVRY